MQAKHMNHRRSICCSRTILKKVFIIFAFLLSGSCAQHSVEQQAMPSNIKISANQRFFQYLDERPFFWLGDTAWLLFKRLDREQTGDYLSDRRRKGFNVIQVMLIHSVSDTNFQGDSALVANNIAQPNITPGLNSGNEEQYDYWDHVDYVIKLAAEMNIWVALVPVWGTAVAEAGITAEQIKPYIEFLAERYRGMPNIVWLNGGDTDGDDNTDVWQVIGSTLKARAPNQLISFHPRGSRMSSQWFHNSDWLDFNMFQSGHRHYEQKPNKKSLPFGPDNWKYVAIDYAKTPIKPTLDGEPSYEEIPYGLHDTSLPYWSAKDVRRYAYWSVFSGAAGFTYGHNSVMQFYDPNDQQNKAFGPKSHWRDALDAEGATQMQYLKSLMLSYGYYDRRPASEIIVNQGDKYQYLAATRGNRYAMVYAYSGQEIKLYMDRLPCGKCAASWFDPRSGKHYSVGQYSNVGIVSFFPPGSAKEGEDWVLVLSAID